MFMKILRECRFISAESFLLLNVTYNKGYDVVEIFSRFDCSYLKFYKYDNRTFEKNDSDSFLKLATHIGVFKNNKDSDTHLHLI